jgi:hypothetical protein
MKPWVLGRKRNRESVDSSLPETSSETSPTDRVAPISQRPSGSSETVGVSGMNVMGGRKKKRFRKKKSGTGAMKPRHIPPTTHESKFLPVAVLPPLSTPSISCHGVYIAHRTNALIHSYEPNLGARTCALDSVTMGIGKKLITSLLVKRARNERLGNKLTRDSDIAVCDVLSALEKEKHPFMFIRKQITFGRLVLLKEGIFICRFNFIDSVTNKLDKHCLVLDCWRQIILDNAEKTSIPFADRTAKQLMRRIHCARLEKVWQIMIHSKRTEHSTYI